MTETQTQVEVVTNAPAKKHYPRISRIGVQLSISPELRRAFQRRARAEGLPFATWLKRLAMRELRRKPAI